MKETIYWIVVALLGLLTPLQEYILTCEALIILNWIADYYAQILQRKRRSKKKAVPVYVQMFFVMVTIIIARIIDTLYIGSFTLSHNLSLGLVFFELATLYKNISLLIGFDIAKHLKKK